MMAMLRTQPEEHILTLIAESKAMLDLVTTTRQREMRFQKFDEPMVVKDPKTKAPRINEESGQTVTVKFIPRSLRGVHPLPSSDEVSEEPRIIALHDRSVILHQEHQLKYAKLFRDNSELEIKIRKERILKRFFDTAYLFSKSYVVFRQAQDGYNGSMLSQDMLLSEQ